MNIERKSPFLTVIIPNYCHERYLKERIESVLNQTYQNFEIILLDDCSKDNSVQVINQYRSHPKVSHVVFNERNSGSTFIQWNRGIQFAKGDLVWIAESDDACHPELLAKLVDGYVRYPSCSLLFCRSISIDSEGNYTQKKRLHGMNQFLSGKRFIKRYMTIGNQVENASSAIHRGRTQVRQGKS